jgi:hypothetical protein
MKIVSVVLENKDIILEPLTLNHVDELLPVAMNPELWLLTTVAVRGREDCIFLYFKST